MPPICTGEFMEDMMKRVSMAALLLISGVSVAAAQSTTTTQGTTTNPQAPPVVTKGSEGQAPAASSGPTNNVVNRPGVNNSTAPVAGANSFTENQAKSRIESNGFSDVVNLKKDDNGIWRATAKKDGKSHSVSLDYQGNVVAQ